MSSEVKRSSPVLAHMDSCIYNEAIRYEISNLNGGHEQKVKFVRRDDPVIIDLRIFIYSIENINTLRQEMLCEFLLSANWYEDLTWFNNNPDDVCWSRMWDPRLYFPNAFDIKTSLSKTVVFIDKKKNKAMMQWSYRVKGKFRCPFDITTFPFDDQLLSMHVSSYWSDTIVKFRQETSIGNNIVNALSTFTDCGQWELQQYILSDVIESKGTSRRGEVKEPLFQFHVHARRKYKYYLWNIASMVNMISLLAFTSFAIDRTDIGKRLSVSLTLLLTVVAFKNFVSSILPKVSYLTLLDKYVLFNVAFIFIVSVFNAIIGKVDEAERHEYDSAFLLVSIIIYILFQSVFIIMSMKAVKMSHSKFCERFVGEFCVIDTLKKASEILKMPVSNEMDSSTYASPTVHRKPSCDSRSTPLLSKILNNGTSLMPTVRGNGIFDSIHESPRISRPELFGLSSDDDSKGDEEDFFQPGLRRTLVS